MWGSNPSPITNGVSSNGRTPSTKRKGDLGSSPAPITNIKSYHMQAHEAKIGLRVRLISNRAGSVNQIGDIGNITMIHHSYCSVYVERRGHHPRYDESYYYDLEIAKRQIPRKIKIL